MNRQSHETPEAVTSDDVEALSERLRVNGFVVLPDLVPLEVIAAAREAYAPLLAEQARRGANRGPGRFHVAIAMAAPFDHAALWADPTVVAICERLLGADCVVACYGSDTPFPGTGFQPVHRDEPAELFPDAPGLVVPAYELTLNIPLVDVSDAHGPMELWPGGTHFAPAPRRIEQVAGGMPSYRAALPAGSAILRDLRTWHRGTPNRAHGPRPMLGVAYTRSWFRYHQVEPVRVAASVLRAMPDRQRRLLRFAEVVDG
jgi:ectoine hydroxylase-related dioxygenase (phytanoyl-CoA dioxygenase family)